MITQGLPCFLSITKLFYFLCQFHHAAISSDYKKGSTEGRCKNSKTPKKIHVLFSKPGLKFTKLFFRKVCTICITFRCFCYVVSCYRALFYFILHKELSNFNRINFENSFYSLWQTWHLKALIYKILKNFD